MTDDAVYILDKALAHRRLTAFGGILKEYHKKLNLDDAEEVKSKLVCNFPRSSVNPLTPPHVNIRVTITVKIPSV